MKISFRKRIVSLVLLLFFVLDMARPVAVYALTAGPTSPEFSSFEPVDATDVVNMQTGDFTYTIPLLHVPSPEGGYPVALSYHAGIKPDLEASWVGLGWTLNAGAINRYVNGHADDFNGSEKSDYVYWEGGETRTNSFGVGYCSVNIGMTYSMDTYKGVGVGLNAGVGYKIGPVGAGVEVGSSAYGNSYLSVNAGASAYGANVGVNATYSFSEDNFSVNSAASININLIGPLGISLSTASSTPGLRVGGAHVSMSKTHSKIDNLSVSSSSWGVVIPIYAFDFRFGSSYTRYFLRQTDIQKRYGALYNQSALLNVEASHNTGDIVYIQEDSPNKNPMQHGGGSYLAKDYYSVASQGISGSISPVFDHQVQLFSSEIKTDNTMRSVPVNFSAEDKQLAAINDSYKPYFRFDNDISNYMGYDHDTYNQETLSDIYMNEEDGNDEIDGDFDIGLGDGEDHNLQKHYLQGSRHIEWFTVDDINHYMIYTEGSDPQNETDFDNERLETCKSLQLIGTGKADYQGFQINGNNNSLRHKIGGFVIVDSDGKKYHYTQPVYAFNHFTRYINDVHDGQSEMYRQIIDWEPYAYTWLLTAITGPDFVDRGEVGVLDEEDFGYWVEFNYGKWTDKYIWRNPSEGFNEDNISLQKQFSQGQKELYYLDAIKTRTHTAIFVKDIRNDAKGIKYVASNGNITQQDGKAYYDPVGITEYNEGGFGWEHNASENVRSVSASSMKLDKILLFTNQGLADALQNTQENGEGYKYLKAADVNNELLHEIPMRYYDANNNAGSVLLHSGNNVIDKYDLEQLSLEEKAVREYAFNTDYDLMPGTPNSFALDYNNVPTNSQDPVSTTGKLTLNSIDYKGLGGKPVMPPTSFSYYSEDDQGNAYEYSKNKHDNWGYYKDDYSWGDDQNGYPRFVTSHSAQHAKAWSLKSITNSLGSTFEVEYESDEYEKPVFQNYRLYPIEKVNETTTEDRFVMEVLTDESGVESLIQNDKECMISFVSKYYAFGNWVPALVNHSPGKKIILEDVFFDGTSASLQFQQSTDEIFKSGLFGNNNRVITCGFLWVPIEEESLLGGGLRVKSISSITDNEQFITEYEYKEGKTFYSPVSIKPHIANPIDFDMLSQEEEEEWEAKIPNDFVNDAYASIEEMSLYANFIGQPTVMYGTTRIKSKTIDFSSGTEVVIPGETYTDYDFITPDASYIKYQDKSYGATESNFPEIFEDKYDGLDCSDPESYPSLMKSLYNSRKFKLNRKELINKLTTVGQLWRVSTKRVDDDEIPGNDEKLREQIYVYRTQSSSTDRYKGMGYLSQVFYDLRQDVSYSAHVGDCDHNWEGYQYGSNPMLCENGCGGYSPIKQFNNLNNESFVSTEYRTFPIVPWLVKTTDYIKGTKTVVNNVEYDFITGELIGSVTEDSYGDKYYTEVKLAHKEYPEMEGFTNQLAGGLLSNKHMLSQKTGTYVYKLKPSSTDIDDVSNIEENDIDGVLSANVHTWSKNTSVYYRGEQLTEPKVNSVWRKDRDYVFIGDNAIAANEDGTYPYHGVNGFKLNNQFDYNNPQNTTSINWLAGPKTNKLDPFSKVIESESLRGVKSSILFDPWDRYVICAAGNASQNEIAYCGAEFMDGNTLEEGNTTRGQAQPSTYIAHTGKYSLGALDGEKAFSTVIKPRSSVSPLLPDQKYFASVWVHLPGESGNGENLNNVSLNWSSSSMLIPEGSSYRVMDNKAGSWFLLELEIDPEGAMDDVYVWCENIDAGNDVYFDDFRVCPFNASISTYVYNQSIDQLEYVLNDHNLYSRFEYDHAGKLKAIHQEVLGMPAEKLVTEKLYNYEN